MRPTHLFVASLALALSSVASLAFSESASAARPPAGHDPAAPTQDEKPFAYRTRAELTLHGFVAGQQVEGKEALPEELVLSAGARFHILDRRVNEDDDYFALLEFVASDDEGELGPRVRFWVDEHELVKGLYGLDSAVEDDEEGTVATRFNLDGVSPAFARFDYIGGVTSAGPDTFIVPIKGARRTSPPGMRFHPILKRWKMHAGWDFSAPAGTPVMAAADGSVTKAGWLGGYGKAVFLDHGKIETRYAHLSAILVKEKQRVKQTQVIGKVGTTGLSTGNHLHYERRQGGRILDVPPGRRR